MNVPKITKYAINSSAGAVTSIPATVWCRRVEISEDDAAANTGFSYTLPDDSFTAVYSVAAAHEPLVLAHPVLGGVGVSPLLGAPQQTLATDLSKVPAGNVVAATILLKAKSLGAATTLVVKEFV
jgi:hypothetical protein